VDPNAGRFVRYQFTPSFLKLKTLGATYVKYNPDFIYYSGEDEKYRYNYLFDTTEKENAFDLEKNIS